MGQFNRTLKEILGVQILGSDFGTVSLCFLVWCLSGFGSVLASFFTILQEGYDEFCLLMFLGSVFGTSEFRIEGISVLVCSN
jgi:hypothetical protein